MEHVCNIPNCGKHYSSASALAVHRRVCRLKAFDARTNTHPGPGGCFGGHIDGTECKNPVDKTCGHPFHPLCRSCCDEYYNVYRETYRCIPHDKVVRDKRGRKRKALDAIEEEETPRFRPNESATRDAKEPQLVALNEEVCSALRNIEHETKETIRLTEERERRLKQLKAVYAEQQRRRDEAEKMYSISEAKWNDLQTRLRGVNQAIELQQTRDRELKQKIAAAESKEASLNDDLAKIERRVPAFDHELRQLELTRAAIDRYQALIKTSSH